MVIDLLGYCMIQEIIRNIVKSELVILLTSFNYQYELLMNNYSELKKFCEDFEGAVRQYLSNRGQVPEIKIKIRKQEFNHTYKSRYVSAEDREKKVNNSLFYSITSISIILYVFLYYKG
jgi:hypothetical protein